MNNRSKLVTVVLLVMTVGLMVAIFYVGYTLTIGSQKISQVAPQKTKAQTTAYNKFVALEPTKPPSTVGPLPPALVTSPTPTSTLLAQGTTTPSPTPTLVLTSTLSPTPTEIVLAQTTTTPTMTLTATVVPTQTGQTRSLPQTGYITNAIVLFGVSLIVVFVSLIF